MIKFSNQGLSQMPKFSLHKNSLSPLLHKSSPGSRSPPRACPSTGLNCTAALTPSAWSVLGVNGETALSTLSAAFLSAGAHLGTAMTSSFQAFDAFQSYINIPWRPEQVWILMVYFVTYRPLLWSLYRVTQTLRGLQDRISMENFTQSFWGFLSGPLRFLGLALCVNWMADVLVQLLETSGNTVSPMINTLGNCDAASYILVFGFFLYKVQDYYLDEFLDWSMGKDVVSPGIQDMAHRVMEVGILLGSVLSACQTLGASASLVAGLYSLLGVGFGFASQEVLQNFFGGLMLVFMRPFQVGDTIIMTNPQRKGCTLEGLVYMIGYYNTIVLDEDDHPTVVPNQWFVSVDLTNKSREESLKNLKGYQKKALEGKIHEESNKGDSTTSYAT
eukprot:CAMPEP_0196576528 /NCGR_PEP_ID=MMETSP1081-20130531/5756_1 /TAXON_ID=36882 /ORGANISM="Pyramimonas amylifera, Strain CCMP720" /LENGTH=387 /DNA_ID=CAMNT_0041895147 /DNA_START=187 /DNA_END=1350 /DNA_ORIENTATION=+